MERSSGADALLNESWTTPWLDEGVFPYWPQAARIGDLEDFLRWLIVQDGRRAALVLTHALEFEKVHRLVTTELSRPKRQQQQQEQQQQHPHLKHHQKQQQQQRQQPLTRESQPARSQASSTSAGTRARGGTLGGKRPTATQALTSAAATTWGGGGHGKERGQGGGVNGVRGDPSSTRAATGAAASRPRESSAAAKSKRPSLASRGVGGGHRADEMVLSWPPSAAARKQHHRALYSRHEIAGVVSPPPAARSIGTRGSFAPRPGPAVRAPTWSSSTPNAAVVADAYLRASRPRSSLEADVLGAATENSAGAHGRSGCGSGSGSGSGRRSGGRGGRSSGSGTGGARGFRNGGMETTDGRAYGPVAPGACPEPSSWGAMAVVAVAAAAAGRTAMVRLVAEAAAAEAEAEAATAATAAKAAKAAAKGTGTGRGGKRGRGGRSPDKHPPATTGGLARGRPRRSSPPLAWTDNSGGSSNRHGVGGGARRGASERRHRPDDDTPVDVGHSAPAASGLDLGEGASLFGASDPLPRGGDRRGSRDAAAAAEAAAAGHLSPKQQEPVRFPRSHPLLGNIDEDTEGIVPSPLPPPPPPPPPEEEEEEAGKEKTKKENNGESWLRMRDPVTLREFWFDPETRAAEWEGGGAMEDTPGGMGLGLLSREDRERLKGKFERRQRRVRRQASRAPGGAGDRGVVSRGTAGLREQVLRKLTLEGGSGESGGGGGAG